MAKKWSKDENKELEEMIKRKIPRKDIAKYFGVTITSIENKVRRLGLTKESCKNLNYFENIDTEDKAYWLGFIYADGYVISNQLNGNFELGIELNIDDIQHLHKFNKIFDNYFKIYQKTRSKDALMKLNNKTYQGSIKTCLIRVYSKNIVENLYKNGVVQNKTHSNIFPIIEDDKLFFHFLRGYIDGDGSYMIGYRELKQGTTPYPRVNITGNNKECFEHILERLKSFDIYGKISEDRGSWKLDFRQRGSVLNLINKLYDNATIYLDRKFNKVNEINSRLNSTTIEELR